MHPFRSLESCEHTLCLHTSTVTRVITLALAIYLYSFPGYVYNTMHGIQCQLPPHSNAFTVTVSLGDTVTVIHTHTHTHMGFSLQNIICSQYKQKINFLHEFNCHTIIKQEILRYTVL